MHARVIWFKVVATGPHTALVVRFSRHSHLVDQKVDGHRDRTLDTSIKHVYRQRQVPTSCRILYKKKSARETHAKPQSIVDAKVTVH